MQKFGNFWVPNGDAKGLKNRKKMSALFELKEGSVEPLEAAIAHIRKYKPRLLEGIGSAIDAGANVGSYTRVLAKNFSTVYAFEPARDTFQCLERNVFENGDYDKVHLYNAAVSDSRSYVGIKRSWFRLSITSKVSGSGDVPTVPLDALKLDDLRFVKLDVEGFEYQAPSRCGENYTEMPPSRFHGSKACRRGFVAVAIQSGKIIAQYGVFYSTFCWY